MRRRWRLAGVAGVAGILAGALSLAACSGSSPPAAAPHGTASPSPAAPEIARLSGIGVTWLPHGFVAEGPTVTASSGGATAIQDFRGDALTAPAHRLTLRVDHGAAPSISLPAGKDVTVSATTIRGHAVRVETIAGDSAELGGTLYSLEWAESDKVHISILASYGATLADAKQLAAGLVLHASDPAIGGPADESEIRTAFSHAYAWDAPNATVLGAVENGPSLSKTLVLLKERDPEIVRTAIVTVHAVTFSDASHASVAYSLSYQGTTSTAAIGSAISGEQGAVKVGGKWKVAQQGYCSLVKLTGVDCPG
jgi:hypothetical protein